MQAVRGGAFLWMLAWVSVAGQAEAVDPSDVRTLKALEHDVQAVVEKIRRGVVAVRGARPAAPSRHYEPFCSGVITNTDFMEFAPGCWLPLRSDWTCDAPAWTTDEHRNRPALTYRMELRHARIGEIEEALFQPRGIGCSKNLEQPTDCGNILKFFQGIPMRKRITMKQ